MTNILLSIIAVLLIARFILSVWQGKKTLDKAYAKAYAVRKAVVIGKTAEELTNKLCEQWLYCDYELVSIIKDNGKFYAFLQSKKIKNYMEQ